MEDKYGIKKSLERLGIKPENLGASTGQEWIDTNGPWLESYSPADGQLIAKVKEATWDDYEKVITKAEEAFKYWRMVPAPKRGEIVRQIALKLREYKEDLGKLVSYEMGKIYQEGLGEVQEMIDIADFAVGLSRQLYGLTMHSERPRHRMYEQWHPLGPVGIITAFNFPVAVWAWNAMIALVAGDVVIWAPSSKVPLCAIAVQNIVAEVLRDNGLPEGIVNVIIARSRNLGDSFVDDKRMPLISFTGSIPVGRRIAQRVAKRLGRSLLELGGNNAIIISRHANLDLALRAVVFGAVGTTGQRCTTTRRLIIDEEVYDEFVGRLVKVYKQLEDRVGHPLDPETLVGPMIDRQAVETYQWAIGEAIKEGGNLVYGNYVYSGGLFDAGTYVRPTLIEAKNEFKIVQEETFAPILYLMKYKTIEEAIEIHNGVPQGLSSAIFSENLIEVEKFLSHEGSDCGIANVNIGTSGAEIGGAFGGEKDTGGGREAGSDAWKAYMRRQTNTINWSYDMPLAQGIKFDLE